MGKKKKRLNQSKANRLANEVENAGVQRLKYHPHDAFLQVIDVLEKLLLLDRHYVTVLWGTDSQMTFGSDNMEHFAAACIKNRRRADESCIFQVRRFEATPSCVLPHPITQLPQTIPYKALCTFRFANDTWIYYSENFMKRSRAVDPNTGCAFPPEPDVILCEMPVMFPELVKIGKWEYVNEWV